MNDPQLDAASAGRLLPIRHRKQRCSRWCWAACLQMVLERWGEEMGQAEIAGRVHALPASDRRSRRQLDLQHMTEAWRAFDFADAERTEAMSFEHLVAEIEAGRPLLAALGDIDGLSHTVLLIGWEVDGEGVGWVHGLDPITRMDGEFRLPYVELRSDGVHAHGPWISSWIGIDRRYGQTEVALEA